MVDSLLTIITDVCEEVGVPPPLTIFGNTDPRAMTFLALAKKEVRELGNDKFWNELTRFTTFNTVVSQQTYTTPADFDRLVPATMYGTSNVRVNGALNPQQWADYSRYGAIYGVPGFRMIGRSIKIVPAPVVVETYSYEYRSKNRVFASNGTTEKETWTADDDIPMLDAGLIRLGLTWRYRYGKGLEYAEDFRTYGEAKEQIYAQQLAHGTLILGSNTRDISPLTEGFVPETGYGA